MRFSNCFTTAIKSHVNGGGIPLKKAITALSLATTLLISAISSASDLNYDYVEIRYSSKNLDNQTDNFSGYDLYLNKSISNNVYLLFDYGIGSVNTSEGSLDVNGISVGAGYYTPINYKTDLYAEIGFLKSKAKLAGRSVDANGRGYGLGVRSKLNSKVEGLVFINYTDVEGKTDTGIDIQLAFELARNMQISAGIDFEDERTSTIALRLNF